MSVTGAEVLSLRIAEQEQWSQAPAVRSGRQPWVDPDRQALERFEDGIRFYRVERRMERRAGRRAYVTRRICKRLVDGAWEDEVVLEYAELVA